MGFYEYIFQQEKKPNATTSISNIFAGCNLGSSQLQFVNFNNAFVILEQALQPWAQGRYWRPNRS